MAEVIFKGGKIQKGDRVKIPKAVIDTLNIKAGESIILTFDPDKKQIIVKSAKKTDKTRGE